MQGIVWDDLKFLIAINRHGSFAAAGRSLSVNETTVARRIERLEAALGTRIADRRRGAAGLTAAGQVLLAHAERMEAEADSALAAASGKDASVAGPVRVTAVPMLINRVLTRALPGLMNRHKGLEIELIAAPRNLRLGRAEADVALRLARPAAEQRALARRVATLEHRVYVARGKRMAALPWLAYGDDMDHLPQNAWLRERRPAGEPVAQVRVHDAETMIACAARGIGKAVLPRIVGRACADLEELALPCDLKREAWLMAHPEQRRLARVEAVMDWIAETLRAAGKG